MYLDANHNVPHLVRPVHTPRNRLILSKWRCCYSQGKDNIPQRCFPYSNLGQECCTALPSVLHWELGPRYLNGGLSLGSQMKSHSPILDSFLSSSRNATKLTQLHWAIRIPWSVLQTSVNTDKVWWSLLSRYSQSLHVEVHPPRWSSK